MAWLGLVDGEQLQMIKVILAQLGFDALTRPVFWDGRDPVKRAELRLEHRRGVKSAYRVDAAHEHRCVDYFQVIARREREELFRSDEGACFVEVAFCLVKVSVRRRVALCDPVQ